MTEESCPSIFFEVQPCCQKSAFLRYCYTSMHMKAKVKVLSKMMLKLRWKVEEMVKSRKVR